jgi:hypothetical protein
MGKRRKSDSVWWAGAYDVPDSSANAAGLVFDNLSDRNLRDTATGHGAHPCMEINQ